MAYCIVCGIYLLDQATKLLAVNFLKAGETVPVLKDVFHLTLVYNTGAAFGILASRVHLFIMIAVISSGIIIYFLRSRSHSAVFREKLSLYFILGGTLGNLTDRLRVGAVIDFFDLRVWPVFNVADSFITIGAVLLAWSIFFKGKHVGERG
ncbi:MAG: signal peptidase II [Candidatus Omnitrophica bacterium]|nr:signal peptidase II [Candidatus Omnitrophota bacterium]